MNEHHVQHSSYPYSFIYKRSNVETYFSPEKAVIYIHIPFCQRKCHFCDYVVYTGTKQDIREKYLAALCKEIEQFAQNRVFPAFTIDAIYIGGGTPGLLETSQILRLLQACRNHFSLSNDCEIGIEFDPASVEPEKINSLFAAGFNRFSMGIQTFDETLLKANNRPHDLAAVYKAWDCIEKSGFQHTNVDLIYPLFGLTLESWEDSLRKAIALKPACITVYPLEIWPKTVYHTWLQKKRYELPPTNTAVTMTHMAYDMLEQAGFVRGSTCGYYHPQRSPRRYSRYLEYYWRTDPLIGFGVSSKSAVHNRLYSNLRSLNDYMHCIAMNQPVIDFGVIMTKEQEMRRVMTRGLKLCKVNKQEFRERFGVDMDLVYGPHIKALIEKGFAVDTPESIFLTREGQVFFANVTFKLNNNDSSSRTLWWSTLETA